MQEKRYTIPIGIPVRFFSEAFEETAKIESGEGKAMGYNVVSFEKRKKENIRDYAIRNLYSIDTLTEQRSKSVV